MSDGVNLTARASSTQGYYSLWADGVSSFMQTMLRSKQLLPFAKGARAWIVAGSVSKPTPLDGTANPAGSDDSKLEQGNNGTKRGHSVKSGLSISRAGAPSHSTKTIHESSSNGIIPSSSVARRAIMATGKIPVKDSEAVVPSKAVEPLSGDNNRSSDPAVAPEGTVQKPKSVKVVLVAKAETTGQDRTSIPGKVTDVGLATLSRISEEVAPSTHGRVSKIKTSNDSNTYGSRSSRDRSCQPGRHDSLPSDRAAPSKKTIAKIAEASSPISSICVEDARLPACARSNKSEGQDVRTSSPSGRIHFGTVDPPAVVSLIQQSDPEAGTSVSAQRLPFKPSATSPHQVEKHAWLEAKDSKLEQDISIGKRSGTSKGREGSTGISGNRRKVNGLCQVGSSRHSHWSANDSGWEYGSNEVVDQVGSILRTMGWTPRTVDALAIFNSKLSAYHINEVLKHQKEPGLAWQFFNWAKRQNGYKHDVRTYTTMIGILGRARNFEACSNLMNDMRREGCEPTVVTFNRLIYSYGRANYLGEALKLFHHMQEIGCEPDRVTYCTLIDLHSKAGFHDVAMDICRRMWQAGFEPDTYSYTLIIHCLGKAGNLPAAYKLFLEMIDNGCTPSLVTYNAMIDLHAKAGQHHMALKLYNDMQDIGYRPDNVTYSVIMDVLGHSGHMDEAENVFTEMEQAGWSADATTFGSMVYMWGQAGNVQKATEWYKRMLDSGLLPNVPTCNSLLWAYMQVNDYEAAKQVLESMPKWGLSPTLPTYTLLLSSCTTCDNQQDVDSTLQIMGRTGHPAHDFLCRLLNERNSKAGTIHVHRFFDCLHEEEHDLKRSFADALIEFFYKLDHKERAGYVWEVAVEKNLYPSAISQKSPNYWIVDLHVMSMGTAVVALLRILSTLRERMLSTGIVPGRIEIVTGWGRHSRVSGFSKIKNVVENVLSALHAPFYVDNSNVGCFIGSGQPLVDWLHQPEMEHMLALDN